MKALRSYFDDDVVITQEPSAPAPEAPTLVVDGGTPKYVDWTEPVESPTPAPSVEPVVDLDKVFAVPKQSVVEPDTVDEQEDYDINDIDSVVFDSYNESDDESYEYDDELVDNPVGTLSERDKFISTLLTMNDDDYERWFNTLGENEVGYVSKLLTPPDGKYIRNMQLSGKQMLCALLENRVALYSGGAGSGKTHVLLYNALQYAHHPHYAGVIVMRNYENMEQLIDRSLEILHGKGCNYNSVTKKWVFAEGGSLNFSYLQHEGDQLKYKGKEYHFIGIDELTRFKTATMPMYLVSRMRKVKGDVIPIRWRAATNPGDVGGCFKWNEDTAVWTVDRGWQPITEVRVGELVWSLDKEGVMCQKKVLAKPVFEYEGDLISIRSRGLKMLNMTPNHRVLQAKDSSYELIQLQHLAVNVDLYNYEGPPFRISMIDDTEHTSYKGTIGCLTVEDTETFYVRQEGSVWVSGNSWVYEMFVDAETRNPNTVHVHMNYTDNPYIDAEDYEKSLEFLDPIERARLTHGDWDVLETGGMINPEWIKPVQHVPQASRNNRVRIWDIASTVKSAANKDPDYTAGALCSYTDGVFTIENIIRFRGTPQEVERRILETYDADTERFGTSIDTYIEMGNNSGSKMAIDQLLRGPFKGTNIRPITSNVPKEERLRPMAVAAENGYVCMVAGSWNKDFLAEVATFPSDKRGFHDDMIDAVGYCYISLVVSRRKSRATVGGLGREKWSNSQLMTVVRAR